MPKQYRRVHLLFVSMHVITNHTVIRNFEVKVVEVARCVAKSAFETRSIGLGVQSCNVGSSLGLVKSQSKSSARTAWHSAGTAWHSAGGTGQHTKSQVDTRAVRGSARSRFFGGSATIGACSLIRSGTGWSGPLK